MIRENNLVYQREGLPNPNKRNINFLDYLDSFYNGYYNKDNRIVRYCIEKFKLFIKKSYLPTHEVTPNLLNDFKKFLEEKLNGETPYNYFTKMKLMIKAAHKEGILLNNPAEDIKNRRVEGLKKDILDSDEIQKLANTECSHDDIKRAFLFCLNTGLRHCDEKKLTWQNVDKDILIIRSQQKTDKPVYLDLNVNAKKFLGEPGKREDLVFKLPSMTTCLDVLDNWVKAAEIQKHITWHSARHSIAMNLLRNGADMKTTSGILGQTSTKHTEKYVRVLDELKKKALNNLPAIEL